jgi:putative spermidine/putrescine transport system substrate-binding protein
MIKGRISSRFGILTTALLAATTLHADDVGVLREGAVAEGKLDLAGFPQDRCNFDTIVASFVAENPGIEVTTQMAEAPAEDLLAALGAAGSAPAPSVPDVVHLDYMSGPVAKSEGLLQPFIANNLNELPRPAYDVEYGDRYWSGAYFYVPALLINTDVVKNPPKSWADLTKPEYRGQIAVPADAASSPILAMAMLSAGRAIAKDGDVVPALGFDHFAAIAAAGNFTPTAGTPESVADGTTPILIASDADALEARDAMAGLAPLQVVVPMRGVTADIHIVAITAAASHPFAAKLWFEHLYKATSQTDMLYGYCHPILWADLADWDMLPEDVLEGKPSNLIYSVAHFPTYEERAASLTLLAERWDEIAGAP